ncbi:hypothetical protein [Nonomuraea pusilla]|uniref:Regulator of chromosome condensation (RCC1) repeat-containing protein n=1 Tax=Nonomuraea pusilla TaxID=46177 RepID=A0A1H7NCS9_9ACTN|nr:hypothetical protein [Nonomuraea pusilla]SEL21089.1 hypothetical protein SAMN05660976_01986 [Nonomuraea pusilla]
MTRRSQRRALTLILAASVAVPPVTPAAHADPGPSVEAWQRSTSVRLAADGSLSDVLALSGGDVWAVGQQEIWDVWKNRGTIRHWNGSAWTEVPVSDATAAGNLRALAAAGASDVWAVGDGHDGLPYLAHGDVNGFERVRAQGLRAGDWLGGVDARQGKVVAVGSRERNGLILTGQNGGWTVQETKETGALYAVSGGFAVGDTGSEPLVMRYADGAWKAMRLPDVPGGYLRDVQVDSPRRAVAVGGVYRGPGDISPLVLTWNGKQWREQRLPDSGARLYGVTGDGKGRYWMAGYDPAHAAEPFTLRCEKDACEIIRGRAEKGRSSVRLQALAYLPGKGAVWAVGHAVDSADRYTDVVESFALKGSSSRDS